MARTRAESAHAFDERSARLIADVVRAWQRQPRNDPYQAPRQPRLGGTTIRIGFPRVPIPKSSTTPVTVDEVAWYTDHWDYTGESFDVINWHNVDIGVSRITCAELGDIYIVIQADCGPVSLPPPPSTDPCIGVLCPPGQHCENGTCVDDGPPPPPPDCVGAPPICLEGLEPCCIQGVWDCCPTAPPP